MIQNQSLATINLIHTLTNSSQFTIYIGFMTSSSILITIHCQTFVVPNKQEQATWHSSHHMSKNFTYNFKDLLHNGCISMMWCDLLLAETTIQSFTQLLQEIGQQIKNRQTTWHDKKQVTQVFIFMIF